MPSERTALARAYACDPPATAMSQYTSTRSPIERNTPVARFRKEVNSVYRYIWYTDKWGDRGR
jgi:hypothetical protein